MLTGWPLVATNRRICRRPEIFSRKDQLLFVDSLLFKKMNFGNGRYVKEKRSFAPFPSVSADAFNSPFGKGGGGPFAELSVGSTPRDINSADDGSVVFTRDAAKSG